MKQFTVLFKKEALESARDFKWIWLPIVFIIISVMEPLTQFYTPEIIEKFGGLPEGAVIEIPLPTAEQVIVSTAGQFSLLGILIVVLAFMGILANERKSGTAQMVLVKPVSYQSFILAKWMHGTILVTIAYFLGMCLAWYYTYQLFGSISPSSFFAGSAIYGLWVVFVFTLTLFFSSFTEKAGTAAFLTLGTVIVLTFLSSLLPERLKWTPVGLTHFASEIWLGEGAERALYGSFMLTAIIIFLLIWVATHIFKRKELA